MTRTGFHPARAIYNRGGLTSNMARSGTWTESELPPTMRCKRGGNADSRKGCCSLLITHGRRALALAKTVSLGQGQALPALRTSGACVVRRVWRYMTRLIDC